MPRQTTVTTDLAWRMEQQRLHLRMRWDDIARAAEITPAFLRKIRNGEAQASALTKARLEDVLQWQPGTIDTLQGRKADAGGDHSPDQGQPSGRTPHTLGDLLVERGLRQPNELVISDQYEIATDRVIMDLLEPGVFDDAYIDQSLLRYSVMRQEIFEETRRQKEKLRDP